MPQQQQKEIVSLNASLTTSTIPDAPLTSRHSASTLNISTTVNNDPPLLLLPLKCIILSLQQQQAPNMTMPGPAIKITYLLIANSISNKSTLFPLLLPLKISLCQGQVQSRAFFHQEVRMKITQAAAAEMKMSWISVFLLPQYILVLPIRNTSNWTIGSAISWQHLKYFKLIYIFCIRNPYI